MRNFDWRVWTKQQAPLWPLALARVAIGVMWLLSLRWKLPPTFVPPTGVRGLQDWMTLMTQFPTVAAYGAFVKTIVLPNFYLFAWMTFLGELVAGLSLLLGWKVRWGALLGLAMSFNLLMGLAEVPGEWPWSYLMMVMWHGVFWLTDAGRVLGLDARASGRP